MREWGKDETGFSAFHWIMLMIKTISLFNPICRYLMKGNILLDNEHNVFHRVTIHGLPADLYTGIEEDDLSTVILGR